jgi:hypothetical protein
MAEPRTVRSPKENIAETELLIVQTAQTEIKETIIEAYAKGLNRKEYLEQVGAIIKTQVSRLPPNVQEGARRALIASWQRWDAEYTQSLLIANNAVFNQVRRIARTNVNIVSQNKTYSIDLAQWAKTKDIKEATQILDRFRPVLTEDKRGAAIIENYDRRVKDAVKMIAADPAMEAPVDALGRKQSLRNLVEMQVRYEANKDDVAKLQTDGVMLVWTSSHADASGRCSPWQGRLYSMDNTSGEIDGIKYTPLDEALAGENGDGNGIINGYNCRHRLVEYRAGSKPPKEYDRETIRKENAINNRQRQYERDIRNLKTEERLLRRSGNTADASELRRQWQAKNQAYEDYSRKNGRAFYPWRTRITEEEVSLEERR